MGSRLDPLGFDRSEVPIDLKISVPQPIRERMTRDDAAQRGLTVYYDGTTCARGHDGAMRYTSNGACCSCHVMGTEARAETGDMRGVTLTARKRAKLLNETTYTTGRRCVRGHSSPRYTSTGGCVMCVNPNHGKPDGRVKYPHRSQHTGTRYRALTAEDGRLVLEWKASAGKLGQLCIAGDGAVWERVLRPGRMGPWAPAAMPEPVATELLAIMLSAQAAPLPKL